MRIFSRNLNLFKLFKGIWRIVLAAMGMMSILFFFRERSIFVIAIAGGINRKNMKNN